MESPLPALPHLCSLCSPFLRPLLVLPTPRTISTTPCHSSWLPRNWLESIKHKMGLSPRGKESYPWQNTLISLSSHLPLQGHKLNIADSYWHHNPPLYDLYPYPQINYIIHKTLPTHTILLLQCFSVYRYHVTHRSNQNSMFNLCL